MRKSKDSSSLKISTIKMGLATAASRISGLLREQVMANFFGASAATDAFVIAFRIPNMLRDLFAESAFNSAFVPVFTEIIERDGLGSARPFLRALFLRLGLITGAIGGLIAGLAPDLIAAIAPGLTHDPEKFSLAVEMLRILSPFLAFISLAAMTMGALNSIRVFFWPSFAPAFFNLLMIASIILLSPVLDKPILSLAWGALGGGLAQLLVQLPILYSKLKESALQAIPRSLSDAPLVERFAARPMVTIFSRLGIGTFGVAAAQVNVFVITMIASQMETGLVSWLSYAFRLFQLPVGVLAVSISGAGLVHFSSQLKRKQREAAKFTFLESYYLALILLIPSFIFLYLNSDSIVSVLFERGSFRESDTEKTAFFLRYYLLGLPFYGLYKLSSPILYALDRPRIAVFSSILMVGINIIFCLSLASKFGAFILPLGVGLSVGGNVLIQFFFIRRHLDYSFSNFLGKRFLKICFAYGFIFFSQTLLLDWAQLANELFKLALSAASMTVITAITLSIIGEFKVIERLKIRRKQS